MTEIILPSVTVILRPNGMSNPYILMTTVYNSHKCDSPWQVQ